MESLGQVAYEAYEESLAAALPDAPEAPPWDKLAPWLQAAWENGVSAAIHEHSIRENDE